MVSILGKASLLQNAATLTAMLLMAPTAFPEEASMVRLAGAPEQIGKMWGEINKEIIVRDMDATYLKRAATVGISPKTLIERSAASVRITEKIAPHWIEESRAIARAAGVDEELYIAFMDGHSRSRFLHEDTVNATLHGHAPGDAIIECTSYAVSRDHARDGAILFHKTRDNTDRPQAASIVESSLKGINKFIAVTDASVIRCSMMVNEKGLAGSADYPADRKKDSSTLHLEPAKPQYRGMMAGCILRHIAERGSNCAEALAIIEDFVAKRYYAGGEINGSHWLFVDSKGVILEVCNNSEHVVSKIHTQKAYFSRLNKSDAARRLRDAEQVDFNLFRSVSRDRSICFGSSISGMTVEIDTDHPAMLTCAWIAVPTRTTAFPLLMGQSHTPAVLVNGEAYALGKKSPGQISRWEAIEKTMHTEKEQLKSDLADSIAAGNPLQSHIEPLDNWSRNQAATLIETLKTPEHAATQP